MAVLYLRHTIMRMQGPLSMEGWSETLCCIDVSLYEEVSFDLAVFSSI